jgi:hypothetical protein
MCGLRETVTVNRQVMIMRHEDCLVCLHTSTGPAGLLAAVQENLSKNSHHHHAITCKTCGAWWFDDIVTGPGRIPVASRRDSVMCGCPDRPDGNTPSTVMISSPEKDCHCTKGDLDRGRIDIDLRG